MKRSVSILAALSAFALLAVGCASAPEASSVAVPVAEAAPAADLYANLPAVKVISDFEGKESLGQYTGPNSKIVVEASGDQAKSGTQSVKVENKTTDWAGAVLELTPAQADWNGYNYLRMWVYGSKSGNTFYTDIEEATDGELFRTTFVDDFAGWKLLEIDLRTVQSRSDYRNSSAKVNKKFESPIKTIQFCCTASGSFTLYFDDFSVEK